jgi:glutamyl-tRNA synthetase
MDLEQSIRKWVLYNAHEFGKARADKVLAKVLAQHPELKKDPKSVLKEVEQECQRVNSLSSSQLLQEFSSFFAQEKEGSSEGKKKQDEKEREILLPNAVYGKAVSRFAPEPSGYLHIGHAKAAFLSFEGALNAGGYMLLRMDDTNPEKEKQEFADAIANDLKWLGISWLGEISYVSDYMQTLYEFADELILKGKAYVCNCSAQEVKRGREEGVQCDCRAKSPEDNLHDFRKMIQGKVAEGEAILRWAGDMKAENTVMRDPTLFRVIFTPHFRQNEKYKCWPSYDFEAPIMDSIQGVTHAMRSKEYELREELYYSILNALELRAPTLVHFSRLSIKGAPVSKRLITPLIQAGQGL